MLVYLPRGPPRRSIRLASWVGWTSRARSKRTGLADLVLLDADPLEDIRHTREIRAVVMDGRLLDRRTLERMRAEVSGVQD